MLISFGFDRAFSQIVIIRPTATLDSQVQIIRGLKNQKSVLMTDNLFTLKLDSVLNTVSGVAYQNGKASITSATVDDKGLTVNFNVLDNEHNTLQVTGSGQSKKGTIDLFSGGKYSSTLTAGLNYFYFPFLNSAKFDSLTKTNLNTRIDRIDNYFELKRNNQIGSVELDNLTTIFDAYGQYMFSNQAIPNNRIATYDQKYSEFLSLFNKYKAYFPKGFEGFSYAQQKKTIDDIKAKKTDILNNLYYALELDSLNKVQLNATYSKMNLIWYSFSGKINNSKYPIYDASASKNLYTSTLNDYFISFSASLNLLWVHPHVNFWFYPTIKYQNNRDFKDNDLLYLDVPKGTKTINGQTVSDYKQTSYYNNIASRLNDVNLEIPLVIYFPKKQFGLDMAVNADVQPTWKNVGGRLGFYIPIPAAKQNITVEPLIRINKLEQSGVSFTKDQLSFGFNLTISLPGYVTGKKS